MWRRWKRMEEAMVTRQREDDETSGESLEERFTYVCSKKDPKFL